MMRKIVLAAITSSVTFLSITVMTSCGETHSTAVTTLEPITYPVLFQADQFTEAGVCGGCHVELHGQWQGSMHSNAMVDGFYQGMHERAHIETNGAIDAFCTTCHTPIGTFSGEVPPLDNPEMSSVSRDGVQCDFCHTVTGATGIGNASFEFAPSDVKNGPFDDAVSPYHGTAYLDLFTKSEFCGMCHNLNHPVNDLPLETTYSEWKNSAYAEQGIQCQDCHMTPGPGVTKPNPGRAASMGPSREQIYTHEFVGGNATELASEEHQLLARERLQAAAELKITATGATPDGVFEVRIDLTNKGAGHYLPTGLTEVRQMWLEIVAIDASGKEIYHSGAIDDAGLIDENAVIFHTIFADKDGNEAHFPWEAESVLVDKRVPPMGTVTENYSLNIPADAAMPLTIKAKLNYRTAPQALLNELMGDESFNVPVIEMTTAETTTG